MGLTLNRNAGFGILLDKQRPIGCATSVDATSKTTYTFAFSTVYASSYNVDTGSSVGYNLDAAASRSLNQAAPSRAVIVTVAAQDTTGRSISSVAAQVTAPSTGGSVTLTSVQTSGSSLAPCGIYVGLLPPVSTSGDTITVTVTFSGAITQGCACTLTVMPSLNSTTAIDSQQSSSAVNPMTLTLGVRDGCNIIALCNCNGASLTGYSWSASNHTVASRYTVTGEGVGNTFYDGVMFMGDQTLTSRFSSVGLWVPASVTAATSTLTVTLNGTPSTPRFLMAASFL